MANLDEEMTDEERARRNTPSKSGMDAIERSQHAERCQVAANEAIAKIPGKLDELISLFQDGKLTGPAGKTGAAGKAGKDGKAGAAGKDGKDGKDGKAK